ncbi:hypothetical protein Alsa1_CDS0253 [Staphylococcus phage Alsa_1]|mgnify:FL=1|nr:hypothetical protein Alsa1_CDS0253 [Staphylococcus phage Alsa_1]WNM50841.1 hypothetical protein Alsa2_CDS0227 [Staphylococcus phage Alsa_2]WNM50917.1 hypothetical protein Alsa3_CDS0048 [Staphylococcus phage Alsa_3]WNM51169.1 hypothetical protein Alsa4_CDS0039 [Staphylococcus phage Alsa_4]WNM56068.1 hypothetical protein CoNPh38_CDS0192 [Staphylococcus phage S-CoN_Ph38]
MLYNNYLRNTTLSTDYGVKDVDSKGVIQGLTKEQEQKLGELVGFTYYQDKEQKTTKKSSKNTVEKPKETETDEPKKPRRTTTRKTTAKSTQSKSTDKK